MISLQNIKSKVIGKGKDPHDPKIFHKLALVAFFAWIGLGSDGLSSSCYGPSEVIIALNGHNYLGIFIGLMSVITIFVISSSYQQIIELFPNGGGGYLVASKLLSPFWGMISGTALMIDYVLTITVSIASGADALFSFLPSSYLPYKVYFALFILSVLTILNMRGVKESVIALIPVFLIFVGTHIFVIFYAIFTHVDQLPVVAQTATFELGKTFTTLGTFGALYLILHAFSMGAGTFTGIEAVSNALPVLKDPKVHTAKITMRYMAISLSITVFGFFLAYLLFNISPVEGKTINAVLFEKMTFNWESTSGYTFMIVTLLSETAILFVAAQTGFLGGPGVLANMALDRWVPTRFSALSDRLVTQKGILLMGGAAFMLMFLSNGSVTLLVVLYSINVFITFSLSQLGMVIHWIKVKNDFKKWKKKLIINGIGLSISFIILVSVVIVKFFEGGWITLLLTSSLALLFLYFRNEYKKAGKLIRNLDKIFLDRDFVSKNKNKIDPILKPDNKDRTAVLFVNSYSGIGIYSLLSIFRLFGDSFKNIVFVQVGLIDAGNFKGVDEIDRLKEKIHLDVVKYIDLTNYLGNYADAFTATGLDIEQEAMKMVPQILEKYPNSIFFGGQVVFPNDTFISRLLHNYTVFSIQRKLYNSGHEFIILPIKLNKSQMQSVS